MSLKLVLNRKNIETPLPPPLLRVSVVTVSLSRDARLRFVDTLTNPLSLSIS